MCIFVASTNGKIVLPLGFKEKNVGSQDLLILQQILVLLWEEIVLEARALRYSKYIIGARKCCKIKDMKIWYFDRSILNSMFVVLLHLPSIRFISKEIRHVT